MKKTQVLKIAGLSKAEKEAAERWFDSGLNKGKELEGDEKEVKAKLKELVSNYEQNKKNKEKVGTLREVTDLVQSLCKGKRDKVSGKVTQRMFTYKEIVDIINTATKEIIEKQAQLDELLQWKKERRNRRG